MDREREERQGRQECQLRQGSSRGAAPRASASTPPRLVHPTADLRPRRARLIILPLAGRPSRPSRPWRPPGSAPRRPQTRAAASPSAAGRSTAGRVASPATPAPPGRLPGRSSTRASSALPVAAPGTPAPRDRQSRHVRRSTPPPTSHVVGLIRGRARPRRTSWLPCTGFRPVAYFPPPKLGPPKPPPPPPTQPSQPSISTLSTTSTITMITIIPTDPAQPPAVAPPPPVFGGGLRA